MHFFTKHDIRLAQGLIGWSFGGCFADLHDLKKTWMHEIYASWCCEKVHRVPGTPGWRTSFVEQPCGEKYSVCYWLVFNACLFIPGCLFDARADHQPNMSRWVTFKGCCELTCFKKQAYFRRSWHLSPLALAHLVRNNNDNNNTIVSGLRNCVLYSTVINL